MRHWVSRLEGEKIMWIAMSKASHQVEFSATHVDCEHRVPPARGNVRLGLDSFWRWYYRKIWAGLTAKSLAGRIAELSPRLVWLMLDFGIVPVMLRMLPHLQRQRLHVSIHDDPVATAERERCSRAFIDEARSVLGALDRIEFTADAVSEELLSSCVPEAQMRAVVTMPVNERRRAEAVREPRRDGILTVGFSGNFMGMKEFACFVGGLRLWKERTGRDWRLLAFGNSQLGILDPRIDARGFTPADEVNAKLQECDLLLLPMALEGEEMKTSVPTKLVSYVECGRMVFSFAPQGSATARILRESHLGPVVSVISPVAVAEALDQLESWDIKATEEGWQSLTTHRFNEDRILKDLKDCLDK